MPRLHAQKAITCCLHVFQLAQACAFAVSSALLCILLHTSCPRHGHSHYLSKYNARATFKQHLMASILSNLHKPGTRLNFHVLDRSFSFPFHQTLPTLASAWPLGRLILPPALFVVRVTNFCLLSRIYCKRVYFHATHANAMLHLTSRGVSERVAMLKLLHKPPAAVASSDVYGWGYHLYG